MVAAEISYGALTIFYKAPSEQPTMPLRKKNPVTLTPDAHREPVDITCEDSHTYALQEHLIVAFEESQTPAAKEPSNELFEWYGRGEL